MADRWEGGRAAKIAEYFPVGEAQDLLARLKPHGYSHARIACESGVCKSTLTKIRQSRIEHVTVDTYRRLSELVTAVDARGPLLRQRFDAEPLICAIVAIHGSVKNASVVTDDGDLWAKLTKLRASGLSWLQADRWANRFGMHPMWVWHNEWLESEPYPEPSSAARPDAGYWQPTLADDADEAVAV